ncbi:carbon-nitrogen hydrolase family protein [uncultured Marinobacter sp.]|uniref:carbon-nitrogen hydrolase family protein n=1 Tax=uncultured Marinobacter sp. TaxID=187379 RepID=UPI00262960FD|nr:carbon-nitrogen hydrolase family protein [uncultured Marinobacter sp.]
MNDVLTTRVAALQVDTRIGDTQYNLTRCKALVEEACQAGAQWIALPEFFNTGVSWQPSLVNAIEDENGLSAQMLQTLSSQHKIVLGGSFLCRLADGSVRNRYQCYNRGELVGYHDKDLPTMWESAFYEGGDAGDTGELGIIDGVRVGTAVCWEFLRTATSRRLRGKVDVIIGGSHWWSIPENWPVLYPWLEPGNRENSLQTVQDTARLVGAPIIHASHCNDFSCPMPGLPLTYCGHLEGQAAIVDGQGNLVAHRTYEQGPGIVLADICMLAVEPAEPVPDRFWLRRRGLVPAFSWHLHGMLGRRWYKQNVKNAQPSIATGEAPAQ